MAKNRKHRRRQQTQPAAPGAAPETSAVPPVDAQPDHAADAERLEQAILLMVSGGSVRDLFDFAQAGGWNLDAPAVKLLYTRADDVILERSERDPAKLMARKLATLDRLLSIACEQGDTRAALGCVREAGQLCGLYPSRSQVKEPSKDGLGKGTVEEMAEFIKAVRAVEASIDDWEPPPYDQLAVYKPEPIPPADGQHDSKTA